jgi:hypothetical protein
MDDIQLNTNNESPTRSKEMGADNRTSEDGEHTLQLSRVPALRTEESVAHVPGDWDDL